MNTTVLVLGDESDQSLFYVKLLYGKMQFRYQIETRYSIIHSQEKEDHGRKKGRKRKNR